MRIQAVLHGVLGMQYDIVIDGVLQSSQKRLLWVAASDLSIRLVILCELRSVETATRDPGGPVLSLLLDSRIYSYCFWCASVTSGKTGGIAVYGERYNVRCTCPATVGFVCIRYAVF